MQQEIDSTNSYNYFFFGGIENSYAFETDSQISYEVKFKSSSYLFEGYTDYSVAAFEFVIKVAINTTGKSPALDSKIPFTIASIFRDFFSKNNEQVVIYICDSSDRKQAARRRKFNQWVDVFKGDEFVKIDTEIIEPSGVVYYNSIIIRADNPLRTEITQAFIHLSDDQVK